jgi:hypothetical protein
MAEAINRAVLNQEAAIIPIEAFNTRYRAELTRSREQRLLKRLDEEFAGVTPEKAAQRRALYHAQMRWVGLESQSSIIETAIEDFLRYEIAVTTYGEIGQVPRQRFREREVEIRDRWQFIFGGATFNCTGMAPAKCEKIGRDVFFHSMQIPSLPLDGASTESLAFLTRGALQKLADTPEESPEVGWHPQFTAMAKQRCYPAA